jgi:hypothetical protein
MLSKRRIRRICAARQRQERAIRLLAYVVLSAAVAAVWSGIAALVLRLSGIGVLAFGAAMFCATLFALAVVCGSNHYEEVF